MAQNPQRVETAKAVSLLDFLDSQGVELHREGNFYRLADESRIVIDAAANRWYHNGVDNRPRDTIDWCTERMGMSWGQAIGSLCKFDQGEMSTPAPKATTGRLKRNSPLLEVRHLDRQGYAYLTKTRGIPAATVSDWVDAGILGSDERHNLVFTALDNDNKAVGQIIRGTGSTRFVGGRGSKDWPVSRLLGEPKKAIIFEAPLDAMAFEALYKPKDRLLLSMGGLMHVQIARALQGQDIPITIAVDNDPAGQEFWQMAQGIWPKARCIIPPDHNQKDWADYLASLDGNAPLLPEEKKRIVFHG